MGWSADREEITRLGRAIDAATPDLTDAEREAVARPGAEAERDRVAAELDAIGSQTDARAWLTRVEIYCDAFAAARPTLLSRTPGAAATWAERQASFMARYPE